jgi:hypothetical protein
MTRDEWTAVNGVLNGGDRHAKVWLVGGTAIEGTVEEQHGTGPIVIEDVHGKRWCVSLDAITTLLKTDPLEPVIEIEGDEPKPKAKVEAAKVEAEPEYREYHKPKVVKNGKRNGKR